MSQIIETGDFHTVQKMQIDEGFFTSPEVREVYRYIRQTYFDQHTHGQVPSLEMVRLRFPAFTFYKSHDTVAILCSHLRRERLRAELFRLSQELQNSVDKDPHDALTLARSETAKLASLAEVGQDLSMSGAYNALVDRYEAVQNSKGILGIPYPWEQLNEETQGMSESQFIVVFGRPKSMKTWIASHEAVHAYMHSRKRVLFYTREMHPFQIAQRLAALITKVQYKAFKNGTLQPEIKEQVFDTLKGLLDDEKNYKQKPEDSPALLITSDRSAAAGGGGGGVGWLQSKIRDFKPHLVVVDGMYLMKDDRSGQRTVDWKAVAHISQDLKLTAQEFNIPLIGVTQANRNSEKSTGEDLTELAFSDSLGQDADAVFRVSKKDRIDENNVSHTELYLTAPGLREGKFDGIVINGEPAYDFSYIRTLMDTEKTTEDDTKSEYSKSGGKPHGMKDPKIPAKLFKKK